MDKEYHTRNTVLAAYLYSEGYTLIDVLTEQHPKYANQTEATFIFQNDNNIPDIERQLRLMKITGNIALFYVAYKKCLKMVKIGAVI